MRSAFARNAILAGVFAICTLATPLFAQQKQAIPGTTVSLVAPQGFTPATAFAGLQNEKTKASVVIVEMPAEAHAQLGPLFADFDSAKANFARQGVELDDRDEVETPAGTVPLLSGTQKANGVTFSKWIALLKGAKTVLVTIQSPEDADFDGDDAEALLKSVSLGNEPSMSDKIGALPFAVAAAEPFRIVDTIGGSGVLMTVGPLNADPSGKQPLLIVAGQLAAAQGLAIEQLSETLLKQTRGLQGATIATREKRPFAGTDGYLLAGDDGAGKRFEQYLAIGPDGRFVRLIAMAETAMFDELKPGIAKVAASIGFKPVK
ncbi:hypothetical protein [Bosea sp. (in: a-proteobacteria)]|uniref:hypothetical protein n=1 Tax=Bosea sp. (in: a-proteobacteria) TaxID=1871050 RepID=UPI002FC7B5B3